VAGFVLTEGDYSLVPKMGLARPIFAKLNRIRVTNN
jgi:hypothetical protein